MITKNAINQFRRQLYENEKSPATICKYVYEVMNLCKFLKGKDLSKTLLLTYRESLRQQYTAQTVNGKLSAINAFLEYEQKSDYKIKLFKIQHRAFTDETRELSQTEYKRLLHAAKSNNPRLYYILMTITGTGIRISELKYITTESAKLRRAEISMKGKNRTVLIPKILASHLLAYAKQNGIQSGCIFKSRNGKPLDRSNICHDMKKLCAHAGVQPNKVFPHNLRHLFARTFYALEKNLAHLADILGHSSVETTRIYIATSAREHEVILNKMRLIC